jgi:hypothetical protein
MPTTNHAWNESEEEEGTMLLPSVHRISQGLRALSFAASIAAVVLFSPIARATINPKTCSSSSFNTAVNINLGATRFDGNALTAGNYINNTNYSWTLMMNPNVIGVRFHTPGFATEPGFDFLNVSFGSSGLSSKITGTVPANSLFDYVTSGSVNNEKTLGFRWFADDSVTGTPVKLDTASFICSTTSAAAINNLTLDKQSMAEGVLIGPQDIVYLSISQPANTAIEIGLEGLGTVPGTDFDLYASTTTSLPDSTAPWVSQSNTPNEFLTIPSIIFARTIYVGVFAFTGGGHFSIHAMNQGASGGTRLKVCTPGFSLNTGTAAYGAFVQMLQNLSLRMLVASHGNYWVNGYDIYQIGTSNLNGSCGADFCVNDGSCALCMQRATDIDACTVGQSCGPHTRVANIGCTSSGGGTDYTNGSVLNIQNTAFVWAHELGHSRFNFDDERNNSFSSSIFCGHTLMSGPVNSNFWCSPFSHCKDGLQTVSMAQQALCNAGQDNWSRAPGSFVKILDGTSTEPDIEMFNTWNQGAMNAVQVVKH